MYRFFFTFFWKKEKQHSPNLSHFENESTIRLTPTTFWKQKLIPKIILEMKTWFWKSEKYLKKRAHFEKEPHFGNESSL